MDLFEIPQPSLVFSPHLWTVGVEYNFSDGSFGQRFTGTITAIAQAGLNVLLLNTPYRILDAGGSWRCSNNVSDYVELAFSTTSCWGSGILTESTGIYLHTAANNVRTNAPYNV